MVCFLGACVLAAQLTSGGSYMSDTPKVSIDSSGKSHDITRFYEVDNFQFDAGGYVILDTNTRIDFSYDNGLKSEKRNRGKSLAMSVTQLKVIDENSYITFGLSTRIGGNVQEVSCTDDSEIDKEFYCDDLQNPNPFAQPINNREIKTSIKYVYKF